MVANSCFCVVPSDGGSVCVLCLCVRPYFWFAGVKLHIFCVFLVLLVCNCHYTEEFVVGT